MPTSKTLPPAHDARGELRYLALKNARPGPFDEPGDIIAEFWRIAAPFLIFGWGVVCGIAVCGSMFSWGWL